MAESGGGRNRASTGEDGARLPSRPPVPRGEQKGTTEEKEGDHGGKKLPRSEVALNRAVLWIAVFFKLTNGLGTLAFVRASVVLLGGFSTLIKRDDFWCVTAIIIIQASRSLRIGSSFAYHSSCFTIKKIPPLEREGGGGTKRMNLPAKSQENVQGYNEYSVASSTCFFPERHIKMTLYLVVSSLVESGAVCLCIFLSYRRLTQQNFVDPKNRGQDDHRNITGSLNIFYGLTFAHSISHYMLVTAFVFLVSPFAEGVQSEYELHEWSRDTVYYYTGQKLWTFINCTVREALEMDLVTFAKGLVRSDSTDGQLQGVITLDSIIRWEIFAKRWSGPGVHHSYQSTTAEKYKGRVLTSIQASTETLEKVVNMLGLNVKSPEEEDTRGHAASIVLELAPYLLLENLPALPQLISSLLITECSGAHDTNSVELTWYGVKILERLLDNPDNRRPLADADVLVSKIVGLVNFRDECKMPVTDETQNRRQEEIIEASLKVLHRPVSTTGETEEVLRSTISKNAEIVSNIRKILDQLDKNNSSFLHAVRIVSCLAMHETAREMIGSSCQIIRKLVSSVLPRPIDIVQDCNHGSAVADTAAQALVLLSTGSEYNKATILDEINLEKLVSMLSDASMERRIIMAHLLKHLRTYSGPGYGKQLKKVVDGSLPKVLEEIKVAVQKLDNPEFPDGQPSRGLKELKAEEGKLLESFIDLSSQICHFLQASDFDNSLQSAILTMDTYAQMLKMILSVCKSPTTDFPGIRRVTINQTNWLIKNNKDYIGVFMRYEMDKALKEVAETATELESFELFCSGSGVGKHDEPISSVVRSTLALLAGDSA